MLGTDEKNDSGQYSGRGRHQSKWASIPRRAPRNDYSLTICRGGRRVYWISWLAVPIRMSLQRLPPLCKRQTHVVPHLLPSHAALSTPDLHVTFRAAVSCVKAVQKQCKPRPKMTAT